MSMNEDKNRKESAHRNEDDIENATGADENADQPTADDETDKLRAELAEQKDKYLRLYADFDNFRKRTAKERLDYMQTAGKDVVLPLLDVLDDCDRAEQQLQHFDAERCSDYLEGMKLIFTKLRNVLQSRGLKAMESIHTEFDVEKHEAISEIPAPSADLEGKVVDEVQKGYYLNDKIIRFAKVVVGK